MDSRFDFISFFTTVKTSIYIDKNIFNESRNVLKYWSVLGYKVTQKKELNNKFIYFYKSRWQKKLFLKDERTLEYICVPSLQNPRWLIRNDKNIIKNHGLIIKPTSFKAKFVWSVAKVLNIFSLFTVVFPYRMLVQGTSLEKSMGYTNNDIAAIIYTGAPGKFQKFTIQFINQRYEIQNYLKLATRKDAIHRIKNEEKALKYLGEKTFKMMLVPQLIETIKSEKFYGIVQSNIISKNVMNISMHSLDIEVVNELYSLSDFSRTTVYQYSSKLLERLSNKSNLGDFQEVLESIKDKEIDLAISHGDYIPWNRFVDASQIKIIDWEMYSYRPIFYDIYFYIIHKAILIDDVNLEDLFLESLNYFKKIDNIDYDERTKIIYLFLISLELYAHYRKNNEVSDEKMLNALIKNMKFLEKKLKKES